MRGKTKTKPIPGDTSDPRSLGALLERYLIWIETHHFATNTVAIRRLLLSRFVVWCLDRDLTRPHDITPEIIERFQRHLFHYRKRDGKPLAISSQSHWLTALRSWFTWLKDQKILKQNPTVEMRLPREEKRLPRHALTCDEVEAILAQPDITKPTGLRTRAIMETLYSTGLRRVEVLNLYLSDIDQQRRVVLVRQGKGHKDRFVPIGERALAWINKYVDLARPQLAKDPTQPLLFISNTGGPVHPNALSALVRRMMNKAGVTKKGACHLFRHTAATVMLDRGADVRHIQAILGHVSLSTTQIYTHVSIGKLCEVHERTHPARLHRPAVERPRRAVFFRWIDRLARAALFFKRPFHQLGARPTRAAGRGATRKGRPPHTAPRPD